MKAWVHFEVSRFCSAILHIVPTSITFPTAWVYVVLRHILVNLCLMWRYYGMGCRPSCHQNNYGYLQEILTRWALLIFSSGRWGAFNGLMRHRDEHRGSQGNAHTHEPSPLLLNGKLLSGGAGPINLSQTLGHWTRLGPNHFVSVISGLCRASHTTHSDLWGCNYK